MKSEDVKRIRESLGMTQAQLAQLLGVHPLTVSKWERETEITKFPNAHQQNLLKHFLKASKKKPDIGKIAIGLLIGAGVAVALYSILKAAIEEE